MADTARTISALKTIFADNITGAISPQDLRDLLESLRTGYGEMSITTATTTTFSDATSFVDINATTFALSSSALNWAMATDGQLDYTGTPARLAVVTATFSMTGNTNDVLHFAIAKNGTAITSTTVQRKLGTGSDVGAASATGIISIVNGDYITLQCKNTSWTASETVTIEALNLRVQDIPE